MKKIIYSALVIAAIGLISSCNKFLDVKPLKEVTSKDLLETRKGLETALGGIYYSMSQPELYGKELLFRTTDALAGYYEIGGPEHELYKIGKYNYTDDQIEMQLNKFWSRMYSAIFNVNNIVNTLEKKSSLDQYEQLVLGEAIGLRAFLHLDLFRLYGPVIAEEGLEAKAIPYRKDANATLQPFLTASNFLKKVEEDLLQAEELLKNDPILVSGGTANTNPVGNLDYNSLLDRRRDRFNVNAASALLARVYQLKGEHTKAAAYAQKTLDATSASFVTQNDLGVSATKDIRLNKEIIFGLNIRDHWVDCGPLFGVDNNDISRNPNGGLWFNYDKLQKIYSEPGDYRRVNWFQNVTSYTVFLRYAKPTVQRELGGAETLQFQPEVSMVSISEMYFILTEAALESNIEEAIGYLNVVRQARGILNNLSSVGATSQSVKEELIKEARRQYVGEGQLFFLLKRLYHDISWNDNTAIPASLGVFKLPIDKKEFDFNN